MIVAKTFETSKGETLQIKQCSKPSLKAIELYEKLQFKNIPLPRKKSLWHTDPILKNKKPDCQLIMDGKLQCGITRNKTTGGLIIRWLQGNTLKTNPIGDFPAGFVV